MSDTNPEDQDFPGQEECIEISPVINWEEKCTQLQNQVSVLKEVSVLRKSLLTLRESETKNLISKLKCLEEAVSDEQKYRSILTKRVEIAEHECTKLKNRLRRNVETIDRLTAEHEEQISTYMSNLEASELKCKTHENELETSHNQNAKLMGQVEELNMKLNEQNKMSKVKDGKLKKATERSHFLSCQVSLISELLHENENTPIDLQKIKTILRQSEEVKNMTETEGVVQSSNDEDEGVELSCLMDNEDDSGKEGEEIPGEESCYKTVDTNNGPQLILSVSRTFIKLKDLILEKKALQKEIDNLKKLNTKLETKVDRQERRLYCVTKEVNRTWSLVSTLKLQQDRLHNSEAVLKYELKERRVLLERLKKELLSYREKWRKVREKNSESQSVWQQLRDEFAQRRLQANSESASSDDTPIVVVDPNAEIIRRPS